MPGGGEIVAVYCAWEEGRHMRFGLAVHVRPTSLWVAVRLLRNDSHHRLVEMGIAYYSCFCAVI